MEGGGGRRKKGGRRGVQFFSKKTRGTKGAYLRVNFGPTGVAFG